MEGGLYSREKCSICGQNLRHNSGRRGCFCPQHPEVRAHSFVVKFPGGIYQRHQSYESAAQSLNYLRHEKGVRRQRFNPDDYRTTKPHSFVVLAPKYLITKAKLANYSRIKTIIEAAADHFGLTNIKDIGRGDLEDYILGIDGIKEKTRFNRCSQLHDFWMWCLDREVITLAEFPKFPKIEYELGNRKITTWEIQEKVISKAKEISYNINPKIWLAIDMLATYTSLRPDDLRRVSENSLDNDGWLTILHPTKKKNKFKRIKLVQDHVSEWKGLQAKYPALPGAYFFRHTAGISGCTENERFGDKYLYKWWVKACDQVGLEDVPLYPGTKHTTATETAKRWGTETARSVSGLTNKAFDRYCQVENSGAFEVVTAIRNAKKKAHVLQFPKSKKETEYPSLSDTNLLPVFLRL